MIKYCTKCQVETERNKNGECKSCRSIRDKKYYAANSEKVKASKSAWSKANPEQVKANKAAWKKANPERARASNAKWAKANSEQVKEYQAEWRADNIKHIKEYSSAYRAANPEQLKESNAAWQKANPESCRIMSQNYRALKSINGGKLSKDLSAKLHKLQRGLCPCCSQPLGDNYHMDHIVPIKKGGPNIDSNIQLLRRQCNHQKHAKDPIDFMQSKGFLL
jgi:5-methylcytosine-specific restriction endonuclease McrA